MVPLSKLQHPAVRTLTGVSISAIAAVLVCCFVHHAASWVPVAFVAIVLIVANLFGTAAGIFSSLVAALVFATWLYAPVGNVFVSNPGARAGIGWMILAGTSLSFLLSPTPPPRQHR